MFVIKKPMSVLGSGIRHLKHKARHAPITRAVSSFMTSRSFLSRIRLSHVQIR